MIFVLSDALATPVPIHGWPILTFAPYFALLFFSVRKHSTLLLLQAIDYYFTGRLESYFGLVFICSRITNWARRGMRIVGDGVAFVWVWVGVCVFGFGKRKT